MKTRFVFSGVFEIKADSRDQARDIVMNDCGLVMGSDIHTTLDDEEVDWDFNIHPEKKIGRIIKKK